MTTCDGANASTHGHANTYGYACANTHTDGYACPNGYA